MIKSNYNQYRHIYIDFFNINQLAWDIEWIIAVMKHIITIEVQTSHVGVRRMSGFSDM